MEELCASNYSLDVGEYVVEKKDIYDVPMVALGDVCEFLPKSKHQASYGKKDGLYPFYTSSQFCNKFCDEYDYNDICLIIGTGGCANIKYNSKFSCSADNLVLKINEAYLSKYIYYYLLFNIIQLDKLFSGSGIKHISKEKLKNLKIPLPSLEVQQQIVDELSLLETSIQTLETRISQLKMEKEQYKKYGRKADIRDLLKESEEVALGDVCDMSIKGNTNSKEISNTGEYPFYKASVFNPSGTNNTFCFDDDEYLLFIKSGGNSSNPLSLSHGIGKVYLVNGKSSGNTEVVKIKNNELVMLKYLYYYLQNEQLNIQKLAKYSTNLGHIDMNRFKKFKIPLPSPEVQQQCIELFQQKEEFIQSIDDKIAQEKKYIEELKQLAKDVISYYC
jgi:type I restriction enzyme S subunit